MIRTKTSVAEPTANSASLPTDSNAASNARAQLIRNGVHSLSESDIVADELDMQSPPRPLGEPAPFAWIRALHKWRADQDVARAGMRCVAWNIDSLDLCVYAQIAPNVLARLLDLHEMSRNNGDTDPVFVGCGGPQWRVTWASAHRLDMGQYSGTRTLHSGALRFGG